MSDFAFGKNTGSTGRKINEQLADEVKRGLWGNGDERKRRLAESGYDYNAVQGLVNAQAANVSASGSADIPSGTLPRQNAGANVPDTGTVQNVPEMGTNISGAQQTAPAAGYDPQANASDFWQRQSQRAQEISGERLSNRRRYGIDLPDDVYEVWNEVISNSENPEEEAHRIGAAYQWSRILGEPLDVCYSNLDALNEEYFGSKVTSYKTGFEAVMDMITLGNNNVKIGVLGNQIRDANLAGDTALAESLMNEYKALQQVNEGLQDNIPRSWITEAFKAGAQSLPFTGYVALSGLFGNFIYPGAGTLTAFNTSAYLTAGQEYMDMLENGSDPFTANIWSIVSGGIQGLIEIQLGNVASALGGGARLMGQEAAKRLTGGAIEKISNTFAKKLHYGATGKMIKNFIARYAGDILEEGAEEALQEITSVVGQEIAAAIDGYDIPENDAASIVSRCMEAFKGGVLGAITLGIPTTGLNLVADIKEYKNIGTLAGMMDSRETFRSAVKDSPVFEGMGDQQKNGVIDDIFKAAQSKRDERTAAAVSGIKEVNRAAEGFEDITVDEETGESSAAPATRDEEGNLYTADTTIKETDAGRTGRYKIGDASPDADEKNLYGYINYEIDEDADTVYIRDFVMNFAREGLRQEAYDDFARYMAGYDIQWDTKDSRAASIKETLINNNPNGKNAGLTYYDSVADIADAQTRQRVAEEVAKYMPRVKAQGHLSAAVSLLESMARSQGKNLTTYMFETFGSNIFGEVSDIEKKANEQGATFEGTTAAQRDGLSAVAGATVWKRADYRKQTVTGEEPEAEKETARRTEAQRQAKKIENNVRAVIYAGQNADFSTWAHELAHVYRQQIKGDLLSQAEKAFNVKDGDWIHSTVRDADGNLMSSEEAFAYGFQDWLKTGKAPTTQMKNIFQRFAEFLARCYNALKKHIEINPDIERVYSQMLAADDSVLAKAEQAVEAADRKIRAQEKKAQADAQARQDQAAQQRADYRKQTVTGEEPEAEKEPARRTEAQRQAEKRDETLKRAEQMARESEANADEEYPLTVAEADEIVAVQDADEARMDDIDGKIKDAVSDKDFVKEQETILNDNDTTQDMVNDVIVDTAGKSFDVSKYRMDIEDIPEDMFFQADEQRAELAETERQIEAVRRQYENTEQWMKAPNGEPTKLTEKQWLQVRTPSFKKWFGDWEKDPANASKVLDENGEPLVVYHGSNHWFTVFNEGETNKTNVNTPAGTIFTNDNKEVASSFENYYGGKIKDVILDKDSPLHRKYDWGVYRDGGVYSLFMNLRNPKIMDYDGKRWNQEGMNINEEVAKAKQEGYDGFIAKNIIDVGFTDTTPPASNDYIAFNNTDVKSATDNNGDFDANNPSILFQIAGEIGAQNLDNNSEVQEGVSRMQNLAVAKQMETDGKDAKAIRLATGWERGADGKWRYEIPDANARTDTAQGMILWDSEHPEFVQLLERMNNGEYKNFTDEEKETFKKVYKERFNEAKINQDFIEQFTSAGIPAPFNLPAVLDYPELYKAYPELKDVVVEIVRKKGTASGAFADNVKTIRLYKTFEESEEEMKSVLLHEIQHAIQYIEGFSTGGNMDMFQRESGPSELDRALAMYRNLTKDELKDFTKEKENQKFKDIGMSDEDIESVSVKVPGFGTSEDVIERGVRDHGADWMYDEIQEAAKRVDNEGKVVVNGKTYNSEYDAYRAIAGETEARNVQARRRFTPEERRNILLAATEDVSRADQIILFQSINTAEQQEQTRSDAFKRWFGDWENDPQNASKVVDENGKPMVMYHETGNQFDTFDPRHGGAGNTDYMFPYGIFTKPTDKNIGVARNPIQMPLYVNMKKPLEVYSREDLENYLKNNVPGFKEDFEKLQNTDKEYEAKYDAAEKEYDAAFDDIYENHPEIWEDDAKRIAFGEEAEKPLNRILEEWKGAYAERAKALRNKVDDYFRNSDYDGIILKSDAGSFGRNVSSYVVLDPVQVKSAVNNNGNFEPANPNILFQEEYDPRSLVPNVRGGWTEKKIIKYLKDNPTLSGVVNSIRFIKEFDTPEELKAHMFYHGTAGGSDKLKPSITMSDRDIERYGGGGYGQKYWSISVSKSKKVASNFAPMSNGVNIYPIILAKNAKVIEMPELTDSVELEDHIIDLWNQGVDAVWIGDKDSGEQELSILNPRAVVNIGRADWYKNYALGTEKNPINIKDDEQIKDMFDYAKNYERKTEFDFGKPKKPLMPMSPFMYLFDDNSKIVKDENGDAVENPNYDAEYAEYEKQMEDYKKQKEEYEQAVNDWYSSDDYKEWEKFDRERRNIIFFQTVYHGSGANFNRFDTENYGLSGEGSMSFGYGTYVTDNEDIARDYAERQRKRTLSKDSVNPYDRNTIEYEMFEDLRSDSFNFSKTLYKKYLEAQAENIKKDPDNPYQDFKANEKLAIIDNLVLGEENNKTNLYTVEIPDDGYLQWDKKYSPDEMKGFRTALYYEMLENAVFEGSSIRTDKGLVSYTKEETVQQLVDEIFGDNESLTGEDLYYRIADSAGKLNPAWSGDNDEKAASWMLHSIGYAGIKYPAGTIYGNGNGAYNYVIFNDDDARIIDHLLFQTEQELYDDAAMFDTWQDFMEAYETSFDPYAMERDDYHSQVPDNADASWYKATWELAHGLKPQESIDQEQVWKEYQEDSGLEKRKDFDFLQKIRQPGELEKFLIRVQQIMDIDLDSPEWRSLDEEDAAERSRIDEMQRYISTQLKHGTWLTNAIRLSKGKPLTNQKRSEMQTLIFSSLRDYRAVYAQVMEDEELAVPEDQTVSAQLRRRIADPDEDFEQMSPERRRQIAEDLSNQEVAARISSGEIKLDSELDGYIKSLKKDIRELSKKAADIQEEVNEDYRRISDAEQRELLRLHEKLLRAKANYGRSSDTTGRRIRRGLRTTQSYEKEAKTLRADYDTIFKQFADLKNVIMITAQVTEAMRHQEQLADMREALRVKQQDNTALQELKKLRVQLVKRTMRRVPFARIDYDSGRLLVAIQRIFEPNLMGGVNEWIGQAAADSRAVASAWLTDIDEREKIEKILEKRGTEASSKMLKMLRDLKSMDDYDDYNKWSNADKKRLSRVMPKEDWIRDLALEQLAKEREESIDLDIKVDEVTRTVRNPKTGEKEEQVRYVIRMPDELAQEVKDALGANLYNDLINKPFSEWTTGELESLAIRVNEIYTDGRDTLAAKRQVKAEEARAIRAEIEAVIRNTGIQINDDDTPEEKKKKLEKIDKILGNNPDMKGSSAAKKETRLNRILHGYADANVRRIARMLDGYEDGINTQELYFKEDECWNSREREKERRAAAVQDVMKKYNLTSLDLNRTVEIEGMNGLTLTVDDLLYIYAADKDYDVVRDSKGNPILDEDGNEQNDDYAPTSRNAVMFGNMLSADENLARKQEWEQMDRELAEAIEGKELTAEQLQELTAGILDRHPGTSAFIAESKKRYSRVLAAATDLIDGNEGLRALYDVITKDYADEFPRMNRVSIEEFNQPVNRVRNYVPLIRLESNGETNANQVKQDLLTTSGGNAAGKIGVNKGMTQRRVSISPLHQKPVQTGLYKTWLGAVDRTEHFIAYAPYVRELNRVYKGRDAEYTRRFIESRYGRGMLSYLDDYINEVANPNANKVRTAGDDLVRTLRGKTAPAYLAWKLSGVLKQAATSPAPYFQFVSPLEYISAAWDCTTNHGYDTIKEKSLFMRSRVQDPVYDLVKELEETAKTPFEQKFMKAQELGMKGLEWIDWACVAPGWLACYKKEYARLTNDNAGAYDRKKAELQAEQRSNDGSKPVMTAEQIEKASQDAVLTDAEIDSLAVRYADDCTRQCQPSSRSTDLAPLYKNSSEFAKAYLQFQTSLNVIWQNIRYDLPYAVRTKQFKRAAGMVAGYVMAGVAMNALMDGVTSGKKDDDDDKLTALRNIIFYSTTQFTDSVPLIGSYLTTVTQKAITGKSSYLTTGTDMTPMITKLGSAVTSFSNGNWTKGAGYFAEGVGLALGLPTSGVKEIYKFFTDEKGNFDVGLGNIYGIVGDFIKE